MGPLSTHRADLCAPIRLAAVLTLALAVGGCGSCGSDEGDAPETGGAALQGNDIPNSPDQLALAFARRAPAETPGIVILRDWRDVFERLGGVRTLLDPYFNEIGQLEAELRNTFGVDLQRPETLETIGIAPRGGLALFSVGDTPVAVTLVSSGDTFLAKLDEHMPQPPFRLTTPPETGVRNGAPYRIYRESPEGPARIVAAIDRGAAILFRPHTPANALEELDAILRVGQSATLADDEALAGALSELDGFFGVAFLNPEATLQRASAQLGPEATNQLAGQLDAAVYGFRFSTDRLEARALAVTDPVYVEALEQAAAGNETNPGFSSLAPEELFAFARSAIGFGVLLELLRERGGSLLDTSKVEDSLRRASEQIGMSFEEELLPSLGPNVGAFVTRLRTLTLSQALGGGQVRFVDLADGLGLLLAVQVQSRDVVRRALDAAFARYEDRANKFEAGDALVYQFTDPESDIGNVILTDSLLLLVPDRQRQEVLDRLAAGNAADVGFAADAQARRLFTEANANGSFIDLREITTSGLGQLYLRRLPDSSRNAMGLLDQLFATMRTSEGRIVTDLTLMLSQPEAP